MFDSLSDKLYGAFKSLTGQSHLTESNIADVLEEVRAALLDADVSYEIVKKFISELKAECIGAEVHKSVTPSQQLIKMVSDKLTTLMGASAVPLNLGMKHPSVIMMVGLHGSGKTTSSAKIAHYIRKTTTKRVMLVAGDIYRPAAIKQLQVLGESLNVPVYAEQESKDVASIALHAIERAKHEGIENVIIDTAGRFQIDHEMVQELIRVRDAVNPDEILLVADAALGQEAVSVAKHFHEALNVTGVILTKLDGDARGGAALSIREITTCPIKFVGMGEKIDELEMFYPDRMASRILGMGDVVSLVERTMEETKLADMEKLQKKLQKNTFDFNDFLQQLKQLQKMGGFESILKLLPGGSQLLKNVQIDPKRFVRIEAMILSMTPYERTHPDDVDFSRRKRIAKGAGVSIEEIAQFVKQFEQMRKMMKGNGMMRQMMGMMGSGAPSGIPGSMPGSAPMPPMGGLGMGGGFRIPQRGSNYTPPKKKRKK